MKSKTLVALLMGLLCVSCTQFPDSIQAPTSAMSPVSSAPLRPIAPVQDKAVIESTERVYFVTQAGEARPARTHRVRPGTHRMQAEVAVVTDSGVVHSREPAEFDATVQAGRVYRLTCLQAGRRFRPYLLDRTDDETLLSLVADPPSAAIAAEAVMMVGSIERVERLALESAFAPVRHAAILRVDATEILAEIIRREVVSSVRKAARDRLVALSESDDGHTSAKAGDVIDTLRSEGVWN